ncbi:phosphotransferase enzyme family protein [Streptomyces sp. NPDC001155]
MDVNDSGRSAALMVDVLEDRYGLAVGMVEPVHMGTDTINWWILTEDGRPLYVKEYRPTADLEAARNAWDMSEYCRAARIPVPRVWPDEDGDLVTIAEGCAWSVTDELPGRVSSSAMTVALAEHVGVVMGRMHRALAAYPMPQKVQHSRWRTGSVEDAATRCGSVLATALGQGHGHLDQLQMDLDQRREDLYEHVHRLRERLPDNLVEQALHADLSRTNLIVLTDAVTGVIDFRGARAMPAWELGRAAFDPRTVANSPEWIASALAMASAYLAENPSLPVGEVRSCARIALLYMLFSFYGATTAEYGLPPAAEADLKQHWRERQTTIRLLLNHLDELEDALSDLSADGSDS